MLYQLSYESRSAFGGIRTHEAYAADLKSAPFDHSGTNAVDGASPYTLSSSVIL
tara:strand:- start:100 stop:261 length:162 start_codon:yes stop_codon:yes gene_type:complete